MASGFHAAQPHVAKNVIVGLDFDGVTAIGAPLRVWYAKQFYGASLTVMQILGETWPKELGRDHYRRMADEVDSTYMMQQPLAPGCKEVLDFFTGYIPRPSGANIFPSEEPTTQRITYPTACGGWVVDFLYGQSFRFAVVTSRAPRLKAAAISYIGHHRLPISFVHATDHSPKDYLCAKLRARAFLDDGLYNLEPLAETFVKPFFLRQPWNVHEPAPPGSSGIITVESWQEFERQLLVLKEMHKAICRFNGLENAYYNIAKIAAFWKSQPGKCNAYLQEYKKSTVGAPA